MVACRTTRLRYSRSMSGDEALIRIVNAALATAMRGQTMAAFALVTAP
jgi:hypothetical protein